MLFYYDMLSQSALILSYLFPVKRCNRSFNVNKEKGKEN